MAVEVLKERGVLEERILFLNLISSPEGIKNFTTKFPKLRVVTAFVDQVSYYWSLRCEVG
jgi:uracil phosphoribosyltransferase